MKIMKARAIICTKKGLMLKTMSWGSEILDAIKNIMPKNLDDVIDGSSADHGVIGKK